MEDKVFDIAIVGGGINGCGIARDAAGRGLSVVLCEKGDLASGTSSASTKLIHGGLRYLESYEFRLVRESLEEREVLLRAAPHIIRPLRFILPHHAGLRPRPIIRLGLWLYDNIGGRKILEGTRALDLSTDVAGRPLKPEYRRAFEYSDCWVDDARLVVLNARAAADRGARILTRTMCRAARRENGHWRLILERPAAPAVPVRARVLVNAAGPWVSEFLDRAVGRKAPARIRLVKGSHVVVDRLFAHERAYIFQNADRRVCFAIPYEDDFTLIGTTDEDFAGDPAAARITEPETRYLLEAASAYFRAPVTRDRVRWSYAGVRPLYDDGATKAQEATRDYVLKLDGPTGEAPLLNVFGGKLTTYRRLAEAALALIGSHMPDAGPPWTASAALPGGDFGHDEVAARIDAVKHRWPFLGDAEARRLFRAYGTRVALVLNGARSAADLGRRFGGRLTEVELDYLIDQEWARFADDVVWRRSKLGLRMTASEIAELETHMRARTQDRVPSGAADR